MELTKIKIVCKGISSPPCHFKMIPPPLLGSSPFLKIPLPPSPTVLINQLAQVFLIGRNATVKLSSMNTIHVKQQHNVDFFIFKFFPKFMLDNVYINKIHARQCLSIISLYYREGFSHAFICLLHLKESFTLYIKIARKKRFLIGATSN